MKYLRINDTVVNTTVWNSVKEPTDISVATPMYIDSQVIGRFIIRPTPVSVMASVNAGLFTFISCSLD